MLYDVLVEICDRPLVLVLWSLMMVFYEFLLPFETVGCIMYEDLDDDDTLYNNNVENTKTNSNSWDSEASMRKIFSTISRSSYKSTSYTSIWDNDEVNSIYLTDFDVNSTRSANLIDHMKCTHIFVDPLLSINIYNHFLPETSDMITAVNEADRDRWKTGTTSPGRKFIVDPEWADAKGWIYNNTFVEERANHYQLHFKGVFRQMLIQPRTITPTENSIVFRLWIVVTFAWYLKTFIKEFFVYKFRVKIMMPIKNQIVGYLELLTLLNGFMSKLSIIAESKIVSQKGHFANRLWYGKDVVTDFPLNPYSWEDKYKRSTASVSMDKKNIHPRRLTKQCLLIPKDNKASDDILKKARNIDQSRESMLLCLAELIRRNPSRKIEVEVLDEEGIRESHFELGLQNLTESLVIGALIYKTFCFVHYDDRVSSKNPISSIINSPSLDVGSLYSASTMKQQEHDVEEGTLEHKRTGEIRNAVLADLNRVIRREETKFIKHVMSSMSSSQSYEGGMDLKDLMKNNTDGESQATATTHGYNVKFNDVAMHKASLPDSNIRSTKESVKEGVKWNDEENFIKTDEDKIIRTNEKVKRCVEWLILLHSRRYKEKIPSQFPTFKRNLIRKYLTPDQQIVFRYRSLSGSEMYWDIHASTFMKIFEDLNDERIKILDYLQNQENMYRIYSRIITAFGTILIIFFVMIAAGFEIGTVLLSGVAVLAAVATFLSVIYKDYAESVLLTCVINPYSVGERITLGLTNGITVVVDKINTFYTTFLTDEGKSLVIPHSQVAKTAIVNLSRSSMSTQMIFFLLDAETSDIRWRALEELLYQYTMTRPEHIIPDSFSVLLVDFQPGHFIKCEIYYCTPISWDKIFIQFKIKEEFLMYMREMCQALNVSYRLPTQRLQKSKDWAKNTTLNAC